MHLRQINIYKQHTYMYSSMAYMCIRMQLTGRHLDMFKRAAAAAAANSKQQACLLFINTFYSNTYKCT